MPENQPPKILNKNPKTYMYMFDLKSLTCDSISCPKKKNVLLEFEQPKIIRLLLFINIILLLYNIILIIIIIIIIIINNFYDALILYEYNQKCELQLKP